MEEVNVIDIFEKIRNYLLTQKPELQEILDRQRDCSFRGKDIEFFKTKLLAVALRINDSLSPGKRRIRKLILEAEKTYQGLRRGPDVVPTVNEEEPFGYGHLPPKTTKEELAESIGKFNLIAEEFNGFDMFLDRLSFAEAARRLVKEIPLMKGLLPYRFLKSVHFPAIIPDARRQEVLFRLGFLQEKGRSLKSIQQHFELVDSIARLTKESIANIDTLVGLYGGGERLVKIDPLCMTIPSCERCFLTNYCTFFKYKSPHDRPRQFPINEWAKQDRPREKLEQIGADRLTDSELVAILIRTGVDNESAVDLAKRVLYCFASLKGIDEASITELCKIRGIGRAKAIEIKAALEIGKRLVTESARELTLISCSADVFEYYKMRFVTIKQEIFILLLLDSKNKVYKEEVISQGSLSSSLVHPREVFKTAIKDSAAAVVLVHNHPSGDPTPSRNDISITARLQEVGKLVGINILDHVIIGEGKYCSFRDEQLLG